MTSYPPMSNDAVVETHQLTRRFADQLALDQVNVTVKTGQVFGIVGENGAGKTTLIKHILGLYKAQQGSIRVFGMNPVEHPESVLARIGYLSEQPDLPAWMKVDELLRYNAAFYPNWDQQYADELVRVFAIDTKKKISELSKGQRARIGLVLAQAHRPELLLLDEPSSGLDPNVRNDILSAIIETVVQEGRTVIFSSHLLEEVERVSNHLMMLSHGNVLLSEPMDDVLAHHHRFILRKNDHLDKIRELSEIFYSEQSNNELLIETYGDFDNIQHKLNEIQAETIDVKSMTLNDIFVSRSKRTQSPTKQFAQPKVGA